MTGKRQTYQQRANMLVEAIHIGMTIVDQSVLMPTDHKAIYNNSLQNWIHMALHPEPKFKSVASLRYLEEAFFTHWNEGSSQDVERFWSIMAEKNIGYTRKDTLQIVLKRKRIKDIHEYDYIIDNIVVAEQLGRITAQQAELLNEYLLAFENSKSRKKVD